MKWNENEHYVCSVAAVATAKVASFHEICIRAQQEMMKNIMWKSRHDWSAALNFPAVIKSVNTDSVQYTYYHFTKCVWNDRNIL